MLRLQKRKTRFPDFAQNVTIQTFRATLRAAAPGKLAPSLYINGLSEFLKGDFLEIAQVLSKHLPFAEIANTDFPESISKANSYGFVQKPWTRISRFPLLIVYSNLFLPKWDLDNGPAPADPYPEAPARGR